MHSTKDLPREGPQCAAEPPCARPRRSDWQLYGLTTPARYWSAPAPVRPPLWLWAGGLKQFLDQAFGIRTVAHVVALGGVQTNP